MDLYIVIGVTVIFTFLWSILSSTDNSFQWFGIAMTVFIVISILMSIYHVTEEYRYNKIIVERERIIQEVNLDNVITDGEKDHIVDFNNMIIGKQYRYNNSIFGGVFDSYVIMLIEPIEIK